jgi:hypothetical protein
MNQSAAGFARLIRDCMFSPADGVESFDAAVAGVFGDEADERGT